MRRAGVLALACVATALVGLVGLTGFALQWCGEGLTGFGFRGATALQLAVNFERDRENGTECAS